MPKSWGMIAMVIGLTTTMAAGPAGEKPPAKQEKPRLRELTAPWDYPGARVLLQKDRLYGTVRLQTADDIEKVYRYYEKLGGAGISLPGGFSFSGSHGKTSVFLDLSQVPDETDSARSQDRPAKVRVMAFHVDLNKKTEKKVVIVISRGKDEKATDIVVIVEEEASRKQVEILQRRIEVLEEANAELRAELVKLKKK